MLVVDFLLFLFTLVALFDCFHILFKLSGALVFHVDHFSGAFFIVLKVENLVVN